MIQGFSKIDTGLVSIFKSPCINLSKNDTSKKTTKIQLSKVSRNGWLSLNDLANGSKWIRCLDWRLLDALLRLLLVFNSRIIFALLLSCYFNYNSAFSTNFVKRFFQKLFHSYIGKISIFIHCVTGGQLSVCLQMHLYTVFSDNKLFSNQPRLLN